MAPALGAERFEAEFLDLSGDSLLIRWKSDDEDSVTGSVLRIPTSAITQLERSPGRRTSASEYVVGGALIAGGAAIVIAASRAGEDTRCEEIFGACPEAEKELFTRIGALMLGSALAIVGVRTIGRGHRVWETVPPSLWRPDPVAVYLAPTSVALRIGIGW